MAKTGVRKALPSIRLRLLRLVVPVGRGQTQIPASRADHRQRCRRRDPWARRGASCGDARYGCIAAAFVASAAGRSQALVDSALAGGQDERAVIGNGNGVLGVGASRAIPAPQGPSVGVGVDLVGAL